MQYVSTAGKLTGKAHEPIQVVRADQHHLRLGLAFIGQRFQRIELDLELAGAARLANDVRGFVDHQESRFALAQPAAYCATQRSQTVPPGTQHSSRLGIDAVCHLGCIKGVSEFAQDPLIEKVY